MADESAEAQIPRHSGTQEDELVQPNDMEVTYPGTELQVTEHSPANSATQVVTEAQRRDHDKFITNALSLRQEDFLREFARFVENRRTDRTTPITQSETMKASQEHIKIEGLHYQLDDILHTPNHSREYRSDLDVQATTFKQSLGEPKLEDSAVDDGSVHEEARPSIQFRTGIGGAGGVHSTISVAEQVARILDRIRLHVAHLPRNTSEERTSYHEAAKRLLLDTVYRRMREKLATRENFDRWFGACQRFWVGMLTRDELAELIDPMLDEFEATRTHNVVIACIAAAVRGF